MGRGQIGKRSLRSVTSSIRKHRSITHLYRYFRCGKQVRWNARARVYYGTWEVSYRKETLLSFYRNLVCANFFSLLSAAIEPLSINKDRSYFRVCFYTCEFCCQSHHLWSAVITTLQIRPLLAVERNVPATALSRPKRKKTTNKLETDGYEKSEKGPKISEDREENWPSFDESYFTEESCKLIATVRLT